MWSTRTRLISCAPQGVRNASVLYLINRHRKNFRTWLRTAELQWSRLRRSASGNNTSVVCCPAMQSTYWSMWLIPAWTREIGKVFLLMLTNLRSWLCYKEMYLKKKKLYLTTLSFVGQFHASNNYFCLNKSKTQSWADILHITYNINISWFKFTISRLPSRFFSILPFRIFKLTELSSHWKVPKYWERTVIISSFR